MPVRPAREEDFEAVLALYAAFGNRVPPIAGEAGRAHWRDLLAHPGTHIHVALDESGAPVAVATLHLLPNMTYAGRPYGLVENVIADPARRGGGYARAAMESLIDTAWAADAYKIMLLTAKNPGGPEARGFYERLGFTDGDKYGMTLRRVKGRFG